MRSHFAALVITVAVAPLSAQSVPAGAPRVAFEVASIRQNASGSENFGFTSKPGGVMLATNVTTRQIIRYAYSMQNSRVEGGPEWLDTVRYDITAKAADAATQARMILMLRTLLADRFALVLHMEARETPIYHLVMARNDQQPGPQLRRSTVDCERLRASIARGEASPSVDGRPVCGGRASAGFISAGAVSMAEVAPNLSRLVGRTIVDRTGLEGRFDFDLKFVPDSELTAAPAGPRPSELPSLIVALEEQLGLKLESARAPVDVAIVDSIRPPIED
jgi:uncharacterized protein (TIGR03435 family)